MEQSTNKKLDDLNECISKVSICLTTLSTRMETWPEVVRKVDNHEARLISLEAAEVQKFSGALDATRKEFDDRLDGVDKQINTARGWVIGASAVVSVLGVVVIWLLSKLIAVLATVLTNPEAAAAILSGGM